MRSAPRPSWPALTACWRGDDARSRRQAGGYEALASCDRPPTGGPPTTIRSPGARDGEPSARTSTSSSSRRRTTPPRTWTRITECRRSSAPSDASRTTSANSPTPASSSRLCRGRRMAIRRRHRSRSRQCATPRSSARASATGWCGRRNARTRIEHSYVQTPAGDVHRAAILVRDTARDFIVSYRDWIEPYLEEPEP